MKRDTVNRKPNYCHEKIIDTSKLPSHSHHVINCLVEEGVYCWDGSLLSNTSLREVIDKGVFIVENYPKNVNRLQDNLPEIYHRARDIMFSDNVKMSKVITQYLRYIGDIPDS